MPIVEAFEVLSFFLVTIGTPIYICFFQNNLDILNETRNVYFKQRSGVSFISLTDFEDIERVVRGSARYTGRNADVINIMFAKRYFFSGLQFVVYVAAAIFFGSMFYRLANLDNERADFANLLVTECGVVPIPIVVAASLFIVYVATIILALNQKNSIRRSIAKLSQDMRSVISIDVRADGSEA